MAIDARPEPSRLCGDARWLPLSLNWTEPPGVPAPGETASTCAVNVTVCPSSEGFLDEVTEVCVSARCTV